MSLGRWFLAWLLLVAMVVLGLAVAVVTVHQRAVLEAQLVARGRSVARTAALAVLEPGSSPHAISALPECVALSVERADGAELFRYGPPAEDAVSVDPDLLRVEETVLPGSHGGSQPLRVTLLLSRAGIRAHVLGTGARLAATLSLVLVAALLAGALLVNRVVEPLRRLAGWARGFQPEARPEAPQSMGGASEVEDLSAAFAQMAERLFEQRRILAGSERRFRELFQASPAALLTLGAELEIRAANPAAEPFLGARGAAEEGLDLRRFLDPATPWERLTLPAEEGREVVIEGHWKLPGGEPAEVELHLRRGPGEGGEVYLAAIHDLTDRVRRLGERWRRTFDNMTDGVALVDAEGAITLANRALEPYLGVIAPEVARVAAQGGRKELQLEAGGRVLRCVLTSAADAERVLVVRDVTDWLRAEEHLREAHKMEAVATLAGGVAHDFNNLLTGVLLHARLLERDPASTAAAAEAIRALAEEGAEVVQGLLRFASPEASPRQGLDLGSLVVELEPLLGHILPPTVRLELEVAPLSAPVLASPADLRRLLLNLVLNARNALAERGGLVTLAVRESAGWAVLEVRDTGPGIPPEYRERVFEPFFTLRREGRGAGLGLAVVYAIVREHAGEIAVDEAPGGGARFTLRLPLRPDLEVEAATPAPPTLAAGRRRHARVLLVDDEAPIRERLADELRAAGFTVEAAAGAVAARAAAARTAPDLVVADLLLADGRGGALVRELRQSLGEVPVVFITGHLGARQDDELDLPRSAVLLKPFDVDELVSVARELLGGGDDG